MQTALLKKHLMIKTAIYIVGTGIMAGVIFLLNQQHQKTEERYAFIQNERNNIKRQLDDLERRAIEFTKDIVTWEKMPEKKKTMTGLRFAEAETVMHAVAKQHFIGEIKPTFSQPEALEKEYKTETSVTKFSSIKLDIASPSDAHTLAFLKALQEEMPGYLHIKSVNFSAPKKITKEILEQIAKEGKSDLIASSLEMSWYDIERVKTEEEKKKEEEEKKKQTGKEGSPEEDKSAQPAPAAAPTPAQPETTGQ